MGTVAKLLPWTLASLRYSVLERNCLDSHDDDVIVLVYSLCSRMGRGTCTCCC